MRNFEEFLDDMIPITKNQAMRREDYYKKYLKGCNPRDMYDHLLKIEEEKKNE